ncbi:hypothetical protein O1611_g1588 [Lasiodiplodia mahajangana]|uniref:Uncharacterized protein n=1 Tax=Lasiodiplodia mahajangana TaxID=1108764 RepID=A0ACC2JXJ3_9PEZI|nr:hypothetical protein O1611_g1588 [Lasiodiplodia mahajangana]
MRGRTARGDTRANNHNLEAVEEDVLLQYVLDLDDRGYPPNYASIKDMADYLREARDAFERFHRVKAQYGSHDDDVWNFDETSFMIGIISSTTVVTRADRRGKRKAVQPGNREWATVICAINNTRGLYIPPYIILQGVNHLEPWPRLDKAFQSAYLVVENWRISSVSVRPTRESRFGRIRGGGKISEFVKSHVKFLIAFRASFLEVFTESNIPGGFRGSGLMPFDPQTVISKLHVQLRSLTPIPEALELPQPWVARTPKTSREAIAQSTLIRKRVSEHQGSSPTKIHAAVDQLAKSNQMLAHEVTLLNGEVRTLRKANEAVFKRRRCKKGDDRMRKIRHGKIGLGTVVVVKLVYRANDDVADAAIPVIALERAK